VLQLDESGSTAHLFGELRAQLATEMRKLVAAGLLALNVISGCKLGPDYRKPKVQIPDVYHGPGENQDPQAQAASFADLPWWEVFQDQVLQELIRKALKNNYDLELATERIIAARAQVMITRSNEFPQITANGVGINENAFAGGFPVRTKYSTYAADATFQLDLFGGLRRATESARARLLSTEYAQKTEILTLVSDVASDYFQLLTVDLQLQVARKTVTTQQDAVRLTTMRVEHGVATKLDVLQAQQVLDTAKAQIPDLERQIGQLEDSISILLGDYPHGVERGRPLAEQPMPPEVPPGVPSSLLGRRPDISEAEQNLIAANAEIGVAKAAFFPQIALTGSGGGAAGRTGGGVFQSVLDSNLATWGYGANITQAIFEGGQLRGNLRLAKSQQRQQLIAYTQAIQKAFRDVSDALIAYDKYHSVRVEQELAVKDLQETVDTSLMRYRGGVANYLEVLDAQRSLFSAELTLAQDRGNEYQSLVQLYKALGGGWQQ
jgi:multidrug efflux system outer membrane protein